MVHYTCDMCGKPLSTDEDTRYVVKIEVYTACDAMDMDDDMDEEIDDTNEDNDDYDEMMNSPEMLQNDEYRTFRFDLCTICHKKYLQDPLFLKSWHRTRFSQN